MKFNIEEMITKITFGNRTIFFNFPNGIYLVPQQPNNLSIEDRLSIHEDYLGMTHDKLKNRIIISFHSTLQTDKQLSTFVAECFALCKYAIK